MSENTELTQAMHFSTFSVPGEKKNIQIVSHKCSGPLRSFHSLTDILEGLINLPCFILWSKQSELLQGAGQVLVLPSDIKLA